MLNNQKLDYTKLNSLKPGHLKYFQTMRNTSRQTCVCHCEESSYCTAINWKKEVGDFGDCTFFLLNSSEKLDDLLIKSPNNVFYGK